MEIFLLHRKRIEIKEKQLALALLMCIWNHFSVKPLRITFCLAYWLNFARSFAKRFLSAKHMKEMRAILAQNSAQPWTFIKWIAQCQDVSMERVQLF